MDLLGDILAGSFIFNGGFSVKTIKTLTTNSQYWKRVPIGTLLRVRDEDAEKVVNKQEATYASKSAWKELRDQETKTNKEAINA